MIVQRTSFDFTAIAFRHLAAKSSTILAVHSANIERHNYTGLGLQHRNGIVTEARRIYEIMERVPAVEVCGVTKHWTEIDDRGLGDFTVYFSFRPIHLY